MNKHAKAIEAGEVTRSNVIGLKKAISADNRRRQGWSVSQTAPKLRGVELSKTLGRLTVVQPRVTGELVESGRKALADRRYRSRLKKAGALDIVDSGIAGFRLVDFWTEGDAGPYPVYEAQGCNGRAFAFYHVPWQAAAYLGAPAARSIRVNKDPFTSR